MEMSGSALILEPHALRASRERVSTRRSPCVQCSLWLRTILLAVGVGRRWEVCAGTDAAGQSFLKENRQREGVIELPSGLQYEILASGPKDGPHPNVSSKCLCHYKGELLNGDVFDSSYKRGQPATFAPNQVVKGWTEALQIMRPGDKWRLFLPSELAYGDSGAGSKIPGGAVLKFELELLEVQAPGNMLDQAFDAVKQQPMLMVMLMYAAYMLYAKGSTPSNARPLSQCADKETNKKVFLDILVGEEADSNQPGRVTLELFTELCPKTVENFRALCTGEKEKGRTGKNLTFKGSRFHRIIPSFMCQGGDFTNGNGTGGESIYGKKFADEFENGFVGHSKAGLLSMANSGKDTNGSQFFITLGACHHLDGKHVIMGQVTDGMDVVRRMEKAGSRSGSTSQPVMIVDCGEAKSKST